MNTIDIIRIIFGALIVVSVVIIWWGSRSKKSSTPAQTPQPVSETPPASTSTSAPKKSKLGWICFGLVVIGFTVYIVFFSPSKPKEEKSQCESTSTIVVKVGKIKTLYRFSDSWDKIVRVDVKSDAEFYPKGGKVKVTTSSGNSYISTPGTSEVRPKKPEGIFTFERKDSTAWGIEVWQ